MHPKIARIFRSLDFFSPAGNALLYSEPIKPKSVTQILSFWFRAWSCNLFVLNSRYAALYFFSLPPSMMWCSNGSALRKRKLALFSLAKEVFVIVAVSAKTSSSHLLVPQPEFYTHRFYFEFQYELQNVLLCSLNIHAFVMVSWHSSSQDGFAFSPAFTTLSVTEKASPTEQPHGQAVEHLHL